MPNYPPIELKLDHYKEGRYCAADGRIYTVARLVEHAKDLPIFDLPLCAINISEKIWADVRTARQLAEHCNRVLEADLRYPVLLDPDGFIMDGWHRIVRAIIDRRETIPARRFVELPCHEWIQE